MKKNATISVTFMILIVIGIIVAVIIVFTTGKTTKNVVKNLDQTCDQLGGSKVTWADSASPPGCSGGKISKNTPDCPSASNKNCICCIDPLK